MVIQKTNYKGYNKYKNIKGRKILKKQLTGNIGEWSEVYVFLKLLQTGELVMADSLLKTSTKDVRKIVKIEKEKKEYVLGKEIIVQKNGIQIAKVNPMFLERATRELLEILNERKQRKTKGAFAIPWMKSVMNVLEFEKIKSPSNIKNDLVIWTANPVSGEEEKGEYSIKSHLGGKSTLLNASGATKITYKIRNITKEQAIEINNINKKRGTKVSPDLKKRLGEINELGFQLEFDSYSGKKFEQNMKNIGSNLPEILAESVVSYFSYGNGTWRKIFDNTLIPKKIKVESVFEKLLIESALGMTPSKDWNGIHTVTGGYTIVKKNGDVVSLNTGNEEEFAEYLMAMTSFDTPSITRHKYGFIYEGSGEFYMDLNFQVRFK